MQNADFVFDCGISNAVSIQVLWNNFFSLDETHNKASHALHVHGDNT